jgi:hypothetical protein
MGPTLTSSPPILYILFIHVKNSVVSGYDRAARFLSVFICVHLWLSLLDRNVKSQTRMAYAPVSLGA